MADITLTDNAVKKIKQMLQTEEARTLHIRMFVEGGGCSGFSYKFTFDRTIAEDDTKVEKDGAYMLVDPISFQYLVGSSVDYVESLTSSQFVINNPNVKSKCGCGSSFNVI